MSEWAETPLGKVMTLDVKAVEVESDALYPIVGVLNRGRGLLYREPDQRLRDLIQDTEPDWPRPGRVQQAQGI